MELKKCADIAFKEAKELAITSFCYAAASKIFGQYRITDIFRKVPLVNSFLASKPNRTYSLKEALVMGAIQGYLLPRITEIVSSYAVKKIFNKSEQDVKKLEQKIWEHLHKLVTKQLPNPQGDLNKELFEWGVYSHLPSFISGWIICKTFQKVMDWQKVDIPQDTLFVEKTIIKWIINPFVYSNPSPENV